MAFLEVGTDNLSSLTAALGLSPRYEWFTPQLIIEYLPCRRFLEAGQWIQFDYGLISPVQLTALPHPQVILSSRHILYHNIERMDFGLRALHYFVGRPVVKPGTLAPFRAEGLVSPFFTPLSTSRWEPLDPKLTLGTTAIIRDTSYEFFQWTITDRPEPVLSMAGNQGAAISHSVALLTSPSIPDTLISHLETINQQISAIIMQSYPTDLAMQMACRTQLEQYYNELELLRKEIRQYVVDSHTQMKFTPEAKADYTTESPPLITPFDDMKIEQGAIKLRSYAEIFFFRAASRAASRAEKARQNVLTFNTTLPILRTEWVMEEMEAAGECIILCALCLEAYINGFYRDHLAPYWEFVDQMKVQDKWYRASRIMGKGDCFDKSLPPYQHFDKLIKWRNKELVHFKHDFEAPGTDHQLGKVKVSAWYADICNVSNANLAIKTVQEMVKKLATYTEKPIPPWLQNKGDWLAYPPIQ